jgi:hypothetical protein
MEKNNSSYPKPLKELSPDELQAEIQRRKRDLERIKEVAKKRGITIENQSSLLPDDSSRELYKINDGIFSCPKCGRYYSHKDVKRTLESRIRLTNEEKRGKRSNTRTIRDFQDNEIPLNIARYSTPSKLWNIFSSNIDTKPPVIYPGFGPESPRPKKGTESFRMLTEVFESIDEIIKHVRLFGDMSNAIFDKYPNRREQIKKLIFEIAMGIRLQTMIYKSTTDDRFKRSLAQWVPIVTYAMETSPKAASNKFYGISPDGKKIRLSPKHIKDMIQEVGDFTEQFQKYMPKFSQNLKMLGNIIRSDEELKQQYERLSKKYDNERHAWGDNEDISNQGKDHGYQYRYYKIVHYDGDLYKKQKSDYQRGLRKSKPDGRLECRVKAEDLSF